MKHLLSILLICSFSFTQELKVEGNLNVTGAVINDSLVQVNALQNQLIDSLQTQITAQQSLIEQLQAQILLLGQIVGIVDCFGVVGGGAEVDECGACGGDGVEQLCGCGTPGEYGIPDGFCNCFTDIVDACGTCGGDAESEDECGSCVDIDGNSYETVQVGNQEWMAENLKTTHYKDGSEIQYIQSESFEPDIWENLTSGAYSYNDEDLLNQSIYGNLYNWYAVNDDRGLCPEGWHVPNYDEWTVLINYLGGISVAGGKMKETGLEHWNSPNTGATNESGFNGLPSGCRNDGSGHYDDVGHYGYFWSSSGNSDGAWSQTLLYDYTGVFRNDNNKHYGFSVRCIKD